MRKRVRKNRQIKRIFALIICLILATVIIQFLLLDTVVYEEEEDDISPNSFNRSNIIFNTDKSYGIEFFYEKTNFCHSILTEPGTFILRQLELHGCYREDIPVPEEISIEDDYEYFPFKDVPEIERAVGLRYPINKHRVYEPEILEWPENKEKIKDCRFCSFPDYQPLIRYPYQPSTQNLLTDVVISDGGEYLYVMTHFPSGQRTDQQVEYFERLNLSVRIEVIDPSLRELEERERMEIEREGMSGAETAVFEDLRCEPPQYSLWTAVVHHKCRVKNQRLLEHCFLVDLIDPLTQESIIVGSEMIMPRHCYLNKVEVFEQVDIGSDVEEENDIDNDNDDVNDIKNATVSPLTSYPRKFRYNISICSVVSTHSTLFLLEWIEYHRLVGIDHFYLYLHPGLPGVKKTAYLGRSSKVYDKDLYFEPTYSVLDNHIKAGVIDLVPWNFTFSRDGKHFRNDQFAAIDDCIRRYADHTRYVATIDDDEYFVPENNYDNVMDVLQLYAGYDSEEVAAFGFGSWVYGSKLAQNVTDVLSIFEYYPYFTGDVLWNYRKTILNPRNTIRWYTHFLLTWNVNSDRYNVHDSDMYLAHYYYRKYHFTQNAKLSPEEDAEMEEQKNSPIVKYIPELKKRLKNVHEAIGYGNYTEYSNGLKISEENRPQAPVRYASPSCCKLSCTKGKVI